MSETIKETATEGEFGDYKLMHGKEGSNWRPIKVDANGELQIDILASALPAGAATAAKQDTLEATLTNIETDIAALEVLNTSIKTAVELIDDAVKTDDAIFTPATDKVVMIGAEVDDTTPDSVDEGDAGALRMDAARSLHTKVISSALPTGAATAAKQDTLEATLTNIETDIAALEVLNTSIKTAVELIDNFISGTKGLVTEDNSAAIKTAVELIDNALDAAGDDSLRSLSPEMLTDYLEVYTSEDTDTIPTPGAGLHIEVMGYHANIDNQAATGGGFAIELKFATSSKFVFQHLRGAENVTATYDFQMSNLRIKGGDNEALTLKNVTFTGGDYNVIVNVYYRIV